MAVLQDLIAQIDDPVLRERISTETEKLTKSKKFGLVYEEHLPECTPLYDMPIRVGSLVAQKTGYVSNIYTVIKIDGEDVLCDCKETHEGRTFKTNEIVAVAEFGEPIYPFLKPIDSVCNAPDSDLWHTLIEADNYHALQLLEYLYAGKVDCIYIDPPYNTGARDWKYNNDYVDNSDTYRHSKWLSMMEKRLKIAKKLLNPKDSVLIVTIDEKEYLHLGCLLEDLFPEARIQMVSTMINPSGEARVGGFRRCGEYIFFVMFGSACPSRIKIDREWVSSKGRTHTGNIRWDLLKRSGPGASRKDSPGGFYPIYINPENGKIEKIGEPLPAGVSEAPAIEGLYCLLPIRKDGSEGRWQWATKTLANGIEKGSVKVGGNKERGFTVYILTRAEYEKIENGEFKVIGHGVNNEIIVENIDTSKVIAIPNEIWRISSHDSTQYGSRMLNNFLGGKRFTFPKSLYAVHDTIRFFVANKPNALIVDFFAGSGTTLHAVNLLNAEDDGHRRCIIVTNNEVSDAESKSLTTKGYYPGDMEWEKYGIARYVTWTRTVCSIEGHDVNNQPLKGNYLSSDLPMADGFKANVSYFKLGFLDKTSVALGRQFVELLPILWMKAGAIGKCPELNDNDLPQMLIMPENKFAVLIDESDYAEFVQKMLEHKEISTIYFITDSEPAYRVMAADFEGLETYQLYRDYLDNFRINTRR